MWPCLYVWLSVSSYVWQCVINCDDTLPFAAMCDDVCVAFETGAHKLTKPEHSPPLWNIKHWLRDFRFAKKRQYDTISDRLGLECIKHLHYMRSKSLIKSRRRERFWNYNKLWRCLNRNHSEMRSGITIIEVEASTAHMQRRVR
jgi:hypothetical protein